MMINPLPNDIVLDVTKFKAFADDKLNVTKLMIFLFDRVNKRAKMALKRSPE